PARRLLAVVAGFAGPLPVPEFGRPVLGRGHSMVMVPNRRPTPRVSAVLIPEPDEALETGWEPPRFGVQGDELAAGRTLIEPAQPDPICTRERGQLPGEIGIDVGEPASRTADQHLTLAGLVGSE